MTCISAAAMALFLNSIDTDRALVTSTPTGLIVHATEGPVEYVRTPQGFCWRR